MAILLYGNFWDRTVILLLKINESSGALIALLFTIALLLVISGIVLSATGENITPVEPNPIPAGHYPENPYVTPPVTEGKKTPPEAPKKPKK